MSLRKPAKIQEGTGSPSLRGLAHFCTRALKSPHLNTLGYDLPEGDTCTTPPRWNTGTFCEMARCLAGSASC